MKKHLLLIIIFFLNTCKFNLFGEVLYSAPIIINNANLSSFTTADINGDSIPDLITTCYDYRLILGNYQQCGRVIIYTNNGVGNFQFSFSTLASLDYFATEVACADLNNDGNIDVITADGGSGAPFGKTLTILTNNGHGGVYYFARLFSGTNPCSISAADLDGDGYKDLVCANYLSASVSVFRNNKNKGFLGAYWQNEYAVPFFPKSVKTADINNDGKIDFICSSSSVFCYTNNGSGVFYVQTNYWGADSVSVADLNANGDFDIVTSDGRLIMKNGKTLPILHPDTGCTTVVAADINGDTASDLVFFNCFSNTITTFTNNQFGNFFIANTLESSSRGVKGEVVDINGDGKLDLISASINPTSSISIYINKSEVIPSGTLSFFLSPQGAISAGCKWNVDGGTWRDSGAIAYGLTNGIHTVFLVLLMGGFLHLRKM